MSIKKLHFSLDQNFKNPFHLPTDLDILFDEYFIELTNGYILKGADILLSSFVERFHQDHNFIQPLLDRFLAAKVNSISLVYDSTLQHTGCITSKIRLIDLNLFAVWTDLNSVPKTPAKNRTTGLLLTGNINKKNRIGLLHQLYQTSLLTTKRILWTLPDADSQINQYSLESKYSREFLDYCKEHRARVSEQSVNWFPSGYLPNILRHRDIEHLFEETRYSIVVETYFDNILCLTEKTWKAILHQHPFIIAGPTGSLACLKALGFETFENYLPVKDYDSIKNSTKRLKAIVTNIAAMPELLDRYPDYFAEGAKKNFNLFRQITKKTKKQLHALSEEFSLTGDLIIEFGLNDNFCDRTIHNFLTQIQSSAKKARGEATWLTVYYEIKGADWPDLSSPNEFSSLPQWIQDECKIKFNFSDKSYL